MTITRLGGVQIDGAIIASGGIGTNAWSFDPTTQPIHQRQGAMNLDAANIAQTVMQADAITCVLTPAATQLYEGILQGTIDTTPGPVTAWGVEAHVVTTKGAGPNPLTNIAFLASATGADQNFSFFSTQGILRNDEGCLLGPTTITGGLVADGPFNLQAVLPSTLLWTDVGSSLQVGGGVTGAVLQSTANMRCGNELVMTTAGPEVYHYAAAALTAGVRNGNINLGSGAGVTRFDQVTDFPNAATGGVEFWGGTGAATAKISAAGEVRGSSVRTGGAAGPQWLSGAGSPEGAVIASVGSLYSRTDGGVGTSLYVKEVGVGNVGWAPK